MNYFENENRKLVKYPYIISINSISKKKVLKKCNDNIWTFRIKTLSIYFNCISSIRYRRLDSVIFFCKKEITQKKSRKV